MASSTKKSIKASQTVPSYNVSGSQASAQELLSVASQSHQCLLIHYMDVIKSFHQKEIAGPSGRGSTVGNNFLKARMAPDKGETDKIILVDDSNTDAGASPINAFTSLGKVKSMQKLGPSQIAGLMPSLRLYKIYRTKGEETGKVEFIFDNYTDKGFLDSKKSRGLPIENAKEKHLKGMDASTKAKGRGVGIKSFNWSFIGGDPFTATRDLTATLSLFFQDFKDLTMARSGVNLFDAKSKKLDYHLLDLVVQPDCRAPTGGLTSTSAAPADQSPAYAAHNAECYEIAVEVGYSAASGIPDQTDTLYLTMVEHSFDIGQDGTFELKIEYRARLASLLGDKGMNILMPGGGHLVKTRTNKDSIIWDMRATEDLIIELERKKDKEEEESVELQELRKLKGWMTGRRNSSIYSGMFTSLVRNELLYKITVKEQLYNLFTYYDSSNLLAKNLNKGLAPTLFKESDIEKVSQTSMIRGKLSKRVEVQEALEEGIANDPGRAPNDTLISLNKKDFVKDIYFTTLGNIILVALEHVLGENIILPKHWTASQRVTLEDLVKETITPTEDPNNPPIDVASAANSLGITTYVGGPEGNISGKSASSFETGGRANPLPGQIDDAQKEVLKNFRVILDSLVYKNDSGTMKAINLAHMPVSLETFRTFMTNKVVASKRNFYSFQDFSKDLLTDIILPSLARTCFGGYDGKGKIPSVGISLLTAQGAVKDKAAEVKKYIEPISANTEGMIYRQRGHGYPTLDPAAAKHASPIFSTTLNNKAPAFTYMMFSAFTTNMLNSSLNGNETEDNDKGIMHFGYGHTKGILKSVNFTKTPIEYLAEERYVREGTDNLLNQLAGRYEAQIGLIGNNLFIPGQYVYFNPVALGIGKPHEDDGKGNRSLANIMGLGGYHIVTEVGNSITPGKYETTIKALWETGGNAPKKK